MTRQEVKKCWPPRPGPGAGRAAAAEDQIAAWSQASQWSLQPDRQNSLWRTARCASGASNAAQHSTLNSLCSIGAAPGRCLSTAGSGDDSGDKLHTLTRYSSEIQLHLSQLRAARRTILNKCFHVLFLFAQNNLNNACAVYFINTRVICICACLVKRLLSFT